MTTPAQYNQAIAEIRMTGSFSPMQFLQTPAAPPEISISNYDAAVQQIEEHGSFNPVEFGVPGVDAAPTYAVPWEDPPNYAPIPYELTPQPVYGDFNVFGA
jgi:hypothetical protein